MAVVGVEELLLEPKSVVAHSVARLLLSEREVVIDSDEGLAVAERDHGQLGPLHRQGPLGGAAVKGDLV